MVPIPKPYIVSVKAGTAPREESVEAYDLTEALYVVAVRMQAACIRDYTITDVRPDTVALAERRRLEAAALSMDVTRAIRDIGRSKE